MIKSFEFFRTDVFAVSEEGKFKMAGKAGTEIDLSLLNTLSPDMSKLTSAEDMAAGSAAGASVRSTASSRRQSILGKFPEYSHTNSVSVNNMLPDSSA